MALIESRTEKRVCDWCRAEHVYERRENAALQPRLPDGWRRVNVSDDTSRAPEHAEICAACWAVLKALRDNCSVNNG